MAVAAVALALRLVEGTCHERKVDRLLIPIIEAAAFGPDDPP